MSALVSPRGLASPSLSARLSNACAERDRETLGCHIGHSHGRQEIN